MSRRASTEAGGPQPLLPAKLSYGIGEAGFALGVSRPTLYRLIGRGELVTFKIGSRTLIMRAELDALLDRLSRAPP